MQKVFVVCEGQTEETFVNNVVAPVFYPINIALVAQLIETSPGHKGGALSYERVRKHLRNELRRNSQPILTTLIDLYKLDRGFPGFEATKNRPLSERLTALQSAFHKDIIGFAGCRPDCFVPYIQPYEFEALLFSDVSALTSIEAEWKKATSALQQIRDSVESPEHIDEGPTTKPAARLISHSTNPRYNKVLHAALGAERITLAKIETECRHFSGWMNQLRCLGSQTTLE